MFKLRKPSYCHYFLMKYLGFAIMVILMNPICIRAENMQLRYDGIYQMNGADDNWIYIKFYPKKKGSSVGSVYLVESSADPKTVADNYFKGKWGPNTKLPEVVSAEYYFENSKLFIKMLKGEKKGTIWICKAENDYLLLPGRITKIDKGWYIEGPEYLQRPEPIAQKEEAKKLALLEQMNKSKEAKKISQESKKTSNKKVSNQQNEKQKSLAENPQKSPKKYAAKKTEDLSIKTGFVTEVISYDDYGLYHEIDLYNVKGEKVAQKIIMRSQFNPTQVTGMLIKDKSGRQLNYTEIEPGGNAKNKHFICLDKDGNFIEKDKAPVLVKPFQALQKTEFEIKYKGAFADKRLTKFHPCNNCAAQTGIKECVYVW